MHNMEASIELLGVLKASDTEYIILLYIDTHTVHTACRSALLVVTHTLNVQDLHKLGGGGVSQS